ncbi:acetylserotonin O-methyltransferase [Nocardia australiensis]|uniref:acetylserotonin O-methyltransferase n=1 Tax=Nocardia australiensis TaxID=2887191 RepID=UPI001D15E298|nr:acetylserotonin O-methyltransferase [Nocardia australiensis]
MTSSRSKMPPPALLRAVDTVRNTLARVHRRLAPGPIALMELIGAGWLSQAIHAATVLGVADALADGPRSGAELARATGADEESLHRLLRLLISHGVFDRRSDGRYTLTPIADALRRDADVTLRDAALFFGSPIHRNHWSHLVDAVRTGRPVGTELEGMPFFEYVKTDRETGELFDRAMTSISTLGLEPLLAAYNFSAYRTIVDVGAGEGALLTEILSRTPQSSGILFDMPEVVAEAPARLAELGLADRCAVAAGSFFENVPAGGDAYILKHIIHDWSDEQAKQILRAVHTAMPQHAKLLLIELVVPEDKRPHPGKLIDLEMLVNAGGRERTESEYRAFLAEAGFTLQRRVPTLSPDNVLEASPS